MSTGSRQRRMTSPADMTRSSLSLPDPSVQNSSNTSRRPPSPLRNAFVPNSVTGTGINPDGHFEDDSDSEDEDDINNDRGGHNKNYPYQSSSPASSVSQLAASFAQRVGSFVAGNIPTASLSGSPSSHLPSDAELEAEAHRDRERSRREAERILIREAEERRMAEERILAMKERGEPLPPPPSRNQTMSNPPSPSGSSKSKDGPSWWTAARNRLTPTKDKEPLTPAQQIILDAKAREKEKEKKGMPTSSQSNLINDPATLNLNIPPGPPSRPVPTSPVSPTPSRNQAPNLTPTSMRTSAAPSPSHPMYAQFTPQGTLDVHGTLLTVVKRFEKLEKWTVGHVRALEDRMNDVERWLVEKEKEKEDKNGDDRPSTSNDVPENVAQALTDMKEELNELQGRVGVLGREMARMGSRQSSPPPLSMAPSLPASTFTTPHHPHLPRLISGTASESTSPPMASSKPTGTRLPYPAGDYASPPDNLLSPTHSPPSSVGPSTRSRSLPTIPNAGPNSSGNATTTTATTTTTTNNNNNTDTTTTNSNTDNRNSNNMTTAATSTSHPSHSASSSIASINSIGSIGRVASPTPTSASSHSQMASSLSLPPPPKKTSTSPSGSPGGSRRQTSVSPTPRKRYTVALGEPIVSREPPVHNSPPATPSAAPTRRTHHSRNQSSLSGAAGASLSAKPQEGGSSAVGGDEAREGGRLGLGGAAGYKSDDQFGDETIGKSASSKILAAVAPNGSTTRNNNDDDDGHSTGNSHNDSTARGEKSHRQQQQQQQQRASKQPNHNNNDRPPPSVLSKRSVRPQSAYDFTSFLNQQQQQQLLPRRSQQSLQSNRSQSSQGSSSVAPLSVRPRWRSQSTDRGSGSDSSSIAGGGSSASGGRIVDPLGLRKQEREGVSKLPMPKPMGKIPVGDLVAFFDREKREKS